MTLFSNNTFPSMDRSISCIKFSFVKNKPETIRCN